MKIRIKRNKKIIDEAAVGAEDIGDDTEIVIYVKPTFAKVMYKGKIKGSITAKPRCSYNGTKVFAIGYVSAPDKYGPLLYDLLMEVLYKEYGAALTSDRETVSPDAKGVWDFYLNNRSDVEKLRMDVDAQTLAFYYEDPPFTHLTKPTSDDCYQFTSLEYASGVGDWMKIPSDVRADGVKYQPNKAKDWHKQSVSYAFMKKNEEMLDALSGKITYNGKPV